MLNNSKRWLLAVGVATIITAGGFAMAITNAAQQDAVSGATHTQVDKGDKRAHGKAFHRDHTALLQLLNIDAETLKTELKSGKTLAVVAQEHGVSEQRLKDFLTEQMTQRIDKGVQAGRITADKAAEIKGKLPQRVSDMINGQGMLFKHKGYGHMQGSKMIFQNDGKLLELLKIDAATLKTELRSGKTLAAVAQEQGVSEQELKDFLTGQMTQRIDEGVQAGRITADKAAEIKGKLPQHVSDMINGQGPMFKHKERCNS